MSAARPRRTIDGVRRAGPRKVAGERGERRVDRKRRLTEGAAIEVRQAHQLVAVRVRGGGTRARRNHADRGEDGDGRDREGDEAPRAR